MRRPIVFGTLAVALGFTLAAVQPADREPVARAAAGVVLSIEQEVHGYVDLEHDENPDPIACDGSETTSLPRLISDVFVTATGPTEILWSFTFGIHAPNRTGTVVAARAWDQITRTDKVTAAGRTLLARDTQMFAWPLPLPAGTYFFTVHVFQGPSHTCMFKHTGY